MNDHHLIMGQLTDYLTGQRVDDTHDERYRQKLARHLVAQCGFAKADLTPRFKLKVSACGRQAIIPVDFLVTVSGKVGMLVKYGPGSLVTRHKPAIAVARIICPYLVPLAVVTNGEDAHLLNSITGKLTGEGLESIPLKDDLARLLKTHDFNAVSIKMVEMANKIIYAFEVDGSCPCDTDICRLP
ncbi:MAG: type I restriction enzyme HsdR N-terminal domain-containing protein [Desulfobacterales bacterium]|nr:type I restriction enzyme HsdR N-terminal domain-containing protein [Desulfobacterales bacterium]